MIHILVIIMLNILSLPFILLLFMILMRLIFPNNKINEKIIIFIEKYIEKKNMPLGTNNVSDQLTVDLNDINNIINDGLDSDDDIHFLPPESWIEGVQFINSPHAISTNPPSVSIDPWESMKKYIYDAKGIYKREDTKEIAAKLKKQEEEFNIKKNKIMTNFGLTEIETINLLKYNSLKYLLENNLGKIFKKDRNFPVNKFIYFKTNLIKTAINGFIVGYYYNGKSYTDPAILNKDLEIEVLKIFPKSSETYKTNSYENLLDSFLSKIRGSNLIKVIISIVLPSGKSKLINESFSPGLIKNGLGINATEEALSSFLKIKIVSSDMSGKVFGFNKLKKELEGTIIDRDNYIITQTKSKKLDGESIYIINIMHEGTSIKFLPSDIEFIPIDARGYILPIDKTINRGSEVKLTKEINKLKLIKGSIGTVTRVVKINSKSKKIEANSETRQLDLFEVKIDNKLYKVFGKYLKINTKCP